MEFMTLALLIVKHYVCDWPFQRPRHYRAKGTYGRWGGIEHALIHGLGTALVLMCVLDFVPAGVALAFSLGACDAYVHYHIDWAKVKLTFSRGWAGYVTGTTTYSLTAGYAEQIQAKRIPPHLAVYSDAYFQALGIDQLLHYLTYVGLVWLAPL